MFCFFMHMHCALTEFCIFYELFFLFCSITFLQISPMWVTTKDLAESVMPSGKLSNSVAEIGISVLQDSCQNKKINFPWILTVKLLEKNFDSRIVQQHFRRDNKYILSHQNVVRLFFLLVLLMFISILLF